MVNAPTDGVLTTEVEVTEDGEIVTAPGETEGDPIATVELIPLTDKLYNVETASVPRLAVELIPLGARLTEPGATAGEPRLDVKLIAVTVLETAPGLTVGVPIDMVDVLELGLIGEMLARVGEPKEAVELIAEGEMVTEPGVTEGEPIVRVDALPVAVMLVPAEIENVLVVANEP